MDFSIAKDSTLPVLRYGVGLDALQYGITAGMWEDCAVTFSMVDGNGTYRVANAKGYVESEVREVWFDAAEKYRYFLCFRFNLRHTASPGAFMGEFKVDFPPPAGCGKLTLPVRRPLAITIRDSVTRTEVVH